jgi:hypothetical protein
MIANKAVITAIIRVIDGERTIAISRFCFRVFDDSGDPGIRYACNGQVVAHEFDCAKIIGARVKIPNQFRGRRNLTGGERSHNAHITVGVGEYEIAGQCNNVGGLVEVHVSGD